MALLVTLVERLAVALRDLALLNLEENQRVRVSRKLDIAIELRTIAKLLEKERSKLLGK